MAEEKSQEEYFQEYFRKMAEIQAELENGDPMYKGSYKSIHAGQALLYDMAACAAAKAEAAEEHAGENERNVKSALKRIQWLAYAVGLIILLHLPQVVAWLEANWPKF
jgi:hypothetical protein